MNYALKEAHGCIPVTTMWFYRRPAFAFSFKLLAFSSLSLNNLQHVPFGIVE